MSDLIDSVIRTRKIATEIAIQSLKNIDKVSEAEIHKLILSKMSGYNSLFPKGWYDPPPDGIAVLFAEAPFKRLQYNSLRNPAYWSNKENLFKKETVASIYFSPVDKNTGMLGDIGFTVYKGENKKIKRHLKNCYKTILKIAKHVETGMRVSDLCLFASNLFKNKFKMTKWVTISSDPNQSINLGHSVPGSFEKNFTFGNTFEDVKESIREKRVPLIETENFKFPKTCVFVVESRLEDLNNPALPSAYFQFFVCFFVVWVKNCVSFYNIWY